MHAERLIFLGEIGSYIAGELGLHKLPFVAVRHVLGGALTVALPEKKRPQHSTDKTLW